MYHPFARRGPESQQRLFWPLLVLTLIVMIALGVTGAPLTTEVTPQGIISFEFMGDVPTATRVITAWSPETRVWAGFNLGLDFLYLVCYSTTIGLGCLWAARVWRARGFGAVAGLGIPLAWGQWAAALFDAVENSALLALLVGPVVAPWPQVAWWCAAFKFALVFLGLCYTAAGAVGRWAMAQ